MLVKLSLGVIAVTVALLGYAAMKQAHYKVSREITIKASPEAIFPLINNAKTTHDWMPWKDNYPELESELVYSGPDEGVGSKSSWDSKTQMGKGESVIIENKLNEYVKYQLSYFKPMEMVQIATVTLIPTADETQVIWEVEGENNFLARLVSIFIDMEKLIGAEFTKGLVKLKAMAEGNN